PRLPDDAAARNAQDRGGARALGRILGRRGRAGSGVDRPGRLQRDLRRHRQARALAAPEEPRADIGLTRKHAVAPAIAILLAYSQVCAQGEPVRFEAVGDAIPRALTSEPGDAARGRSIVVNRDAGACTLCHAVPGETNSGNIAPTLAGVGARLSPAQLRLRVADSTRVNPESPMPAYDRTEGP